MPILAAFCGERLTMLDQALYYCLFLLEKTSKFFEVTYLLFQQFPLEQQS